MASSSFVKAFSCRCCCGLKTKQPGSLKLLWGETIGTVMNVSNVSLEGVFRRFLRFNGERRNGLRNVSDVSRSRGFSIRRLRCVHFSRLMRAHLHSLLPIKCGEEPI